MCVVHVKFMCLKVRCAKKTCVWREIHSNDSIRGKSDAFKQISGVEKREKHVSYIKAFISLFCCRNCGHEFDIAFVFVSRGDSFAQKQIMAI